MISFTEAWRLEFSWRSVLSTHIFNSPPRLTLPSLHTDYAFTLLTYAFALSNLARVTVLSLGTYEHDRAISEADRRIKDEKLNVAVSFLCTASGVFDFVGEKVVPEWEANTGGGTQGLSRPPELSQEVNRALAKSAYSSQIYGKGRSSMD